MAYTAYAQYNILFSNEADYNFAVAVAGGNSIDISPRGAAALFGIPVPYPSGDLATIDKTITFISPFDPGSEIGHPGPSGVFVDDTIDSMFVPGQSGNPISAFPKGPDMNLIWTGAILRINANVDITAPPPNIIPQRRWIHGMELIPNSEGGSTSEAAMSRIASRTVAGFGYGLRGNNSILTISHSLNEFRTGLTSKTSWERFYFRLRTIGTTNCGFWRSNGATSANAGIGLKFNTLGGIDVVNINAINNEQAVPSFFPAIELNRYYRLDIFVNFSTTVGDTHLIILLNGVPVVSFMDAAHFGIGSQNGHISSVLGRWTIASDNQIEYDCDDWINSDLPINVDPQQGLYFTDDFRSIDWLAGSHIRPAISLSATTVGWTGNQEVLNQTLSPFTNLNNKLTSVTSGATIDGTTDVNNDQDEIAQKLGPVAAVIADESLNAASTDGKLGYRLAGGAPVLTTINQVNIDRIHSVAYQPSGLTEPQDIVPFHIVKTKSLDANQDITDMLQAAIEYIGIWGPEDAGPEADATDNVNVMDAIHNCLYTGSLWGYIGALTDAPVAAIGGTYIGNGTFQDINLPLPVHFLLIRPLTGANSGIRFFGASISPHLGVTQQNVPNVRVWMDSLQQVKFTVSGTDPQVNANGVTFQYIAFCDPGMRYNICGAYNFPSTGPSPRTTNLIDPNFTPEWIWIQKEVPNSPSAVSGLAVKGPSFTGDNGVTISGTNIPNFGNFATGRLITRSDIHYNIAGQNNYSLWRKSDSICGNIMLQIFSYIGNGLASRVIPFPDVTGRFPLFVHIQPSNSDGKFRDPSHAGVNSSLASTMGNTTSGITAGAVDSITVGIGCNANGINHDVFLILGSDLGWLNGTYFPPNCEAPYPVPPKPPLPEIAVRAEGGLVLGGSTPITLLRDVSGIYTLVPGKTNDTLIDRQTGVASVDVKIPDPIWKTGYIGG